MAPAAAVVAVAQALAAAAAAAAPAPAAPHSPGALNCPTSKSRFGLRDYDGMGPGLLVFAWHLAYPNGYQPAASRASESRSSMRVA